MIDVIHDLIGFLYTQVFSSSMPTLLVFRLLTQPGPERPLSVHLANRPVSQREQPGLGPVLTELTIQRGRAGVGMEIVCDMRPYSHGQETRRRKM